MSDISFSTLLKQHNDSAKALLMRLLDCKRTREGTALASAARTAATNSADFTNHDCRGIIVFLNITAVPGLGGIGVRLQVKDPVSLAYNEVNASPTPSTTTGLKVYMFSPGLTAFNQSTAQNASVSLSRIFRLRVEVATADSYTYSLAYCLIP